MPLIVAFEGIAGTGKTTISNRLSSDYPDLVRVIEEFPQDFIKDYLGTLAKKDPEFKLSDNIPTPLSQTFLFATNAAYKMEKAQAEKEKPIILMDRYKYSVWAHQEVILSNSGVLQEQREILERAVSSLPNPDLIVYFDGDIDLMKKRLSARSSIYSEAYFDFIEATKNQYERIMQGCPIPRINLSSTNTVNQNYSMIKERIFCTLK